MAMTKKTAMAIMMALQVFGTAEFTEADWNKAGIPLTIGTAIGHGAVEVIKHTTRQYYTLQEIVNELNDCAGNDCWSCDWHYEIDESGRVYMDFVTRTYRMVQGQE